MLFNSKTLYSIITRQIPSWEGISPFCRRLPRHYIDVIMSAMASQISVSLVCATVYSGANQRKHRSSASLAIVRESGGFPSQRPVTRKMFPFDDVIVGILSEADVRCSIWNATLVTIITRSTILAYYLYVKSLQLIWISGKRKWDLRVPDLQASGRDTFEFVFDCLVEMENAKLGNSNIFVTTQARE